MKKGPPNPESHQELQQTAVPAARSGGYSSPSIVDRRRRILSTARKLIASKGLAEVSMDEIAERTQVAKRTLYNIFKSRDLLLATAIQQYFADYEIQIHYRTPPASAERIVEHLAVVTRRNLGVRDYTRTLLNIFFTSEGRTDIREAIFEIAAHSHRPWIERLHGEGQLHPWIDHRVLVEDLVRYRYSVGSDWAQGRLEDSRFAHTVIQGVLAIVGGCVRLRARREIEIVASQWERFVPSD